jgi:predicted TIM-barrel fold metal-dependent hydrolase
MFGSLDFDHYFYQGYNELEELAVNQHIFGIKIYTCYQDIDLQGDRFKKVLDLARQHNLPVMYHAGYSYASMRKYGRATIGTPQDANTLEVVAKEHPDIVMIFSHMSKPFFHEMVRVAKNNDNVFTDMSGLIDSAFNQNEIPICIEEIKTFLGECGPKKLLFGTDFPVQTHEHSVHFIEEAMKTGWKRKDKEDVYYNNAFKILRLVDNDV